MYKKCSIPKVEHGLKMEKLKMEKTCSEHFLHELSIYICTQNYVGVYDDSGLAGLFEQAVSMGSMWLGGLFVDFGGVGHTKSLQISPIPPNEVSSTFHKGI